MFCRGCGATLKEGVQFCASCGAKTAVNEQHTQNIVQQRAYGAQQTAGPEPMRSRTQPVPPPVQEHYPTGQREPVEHDRSQPEKKKKPAGLSTILIVAAIVVVLAAGGFGAYKLFFEKTDESETLPEVTVTNTPVGSVGANKTDDIELPFVSYTYMDKKPEAIIEFTAIDSIFPSNYRMLDALIVFTGYSDFGELDIMIEVEVPGFTQAYKQKVTLGRQVTKLRIIPPLVTGEIDLNTEKTAQLVYSATEVDTGKILVQESKNLKLFSKFDMVWGDEEDWDAYTDNILAWMTPDSPEILQLKRDAIDYLELISDGAITALLGYQDYNFFEHYYYNTWVQAVAIQGAMSDITKVRYNNSHFSMDAQQRVKLPADTLNSRSGLCIETSLVMASALQSTGMHVMLIFPPGHAQVAVEAWPGTGDYFLIETTVLPMSQDMDTWDNTVRYLDSDDWLGYISGEGSYTYGPCYVVDCDLGEKLGIRAMSN